MIEFTDNTKAYTIYEAAEILNFTPISIRYFLKHGELHSEKYGRNTYIHEDELRRFINERTKNDNPSQ